MRHLAAAGFCGLCSVGCAFALLIAAPGLAASTVKCKVSEHIVVQLASPTNPARTDTVGDLVVPTDAKVIDTTASLVDPAINTAPSPHGLPSGETWTVRYMGRPTATYPVPGGSANPKAQWLLVVSVADPTKAFPNPTQIPPWIWTLTYSLPGSSCPTGATQLSSSAGAPTPTKPKTEITATPKAKALYALRDLINVALKSGSSWSVGKEQKSLQLINNGWLRYFGPGKPPFQGFPDDLWKEVTKLYSRALQESKVSPPSPAYRNAVSEYLTFLEHDVDARYNAMKAAGLTGGLSG